jgi:hypothetical protein
MFVFLLALFLLVLGCPYFLILIFWNTNFKGVKPTKPEIVEKELVIWQEYNFS